jgi:hypothetical protein
MRDVKPGAGAIRVKKMEEHRRLHGRNEAVSQVNVFPGFYSMVFFG